MSAIRVTFTIKLTKILFVKNLKSQNLCFSFLSVSIVVSLRYQSFIRMFKLEDDYCIKLHAKKKQSTSLVDDTVRR